MIRTRELRDGYRTEFGNGRLLGIGDMPVDKGGQGAGFRPHELLEAALATCLSMTVRIAAGKYGYPLEEVVVSVTVERGDPAAIRMDYSLELHGNLTPEQRERLERAAANCPVGQTLAAAPRLRKRQGQTPAPA